MNEDIYLKIDELSDLLLNRECIKELKLIEKEMEENDEVISLSNKYSKAQLEYADALKHYSEGSSELLEFQKNLFNIKFELDNHPIVLKYSNKLIEVNEPLRYLELNLLSRFNVSKGSCK